MPSKNWFECICVNYYQFSNKKNSEIICVGFFDEKIATLQEWRSIKKFFFFGDSINMFEVCNCKKEVIK